MRRRGALFVVALLLVGLSSDAAWKFNPFTGKQDYYEASGAVSDNSITNAKINSAAEIAGTKLQYKMNQSVRTSDNVTFGTVTATEFVSSAADNTRGVTVPNTADPTGANLAAGKIWVKGNLLKVRNNDNNATMAINDVQWHRINIDAPTTADNVVFAGPLERAQTIDNVLFLVQDNTGKLSGSASDNVTANVSYCSSIATPTCTNVFSSDQVVTGAAISAGAMNNTGPSAGDYMRVTISAANMTNKKLYIRIKYRSL